MQRRRVIALMYGISKSGFSLIEIIIALLIIGILVGGIPRLMVGTTEPIDDVVEQINKLTRVAYIRAILVGKVHRIVFQFAQHARVQLEVGDEDNGEITFRPAKDVIVKSSFEWDDRFEIVRFVVKNIDDARGGLLKDAWFYIMPAGVAQSVVIGIRDHETGVTRELVLNPFLVKFTLYDSLQASGTTY